MMALPGIVVQAGVMAMMVVLTGLAFVSARPSASPNAMGRPAAVVQLPAGHVGAESASQTIESLEKWPSR